MKGMVFTDFGLPEDVLKIMEVEKPVPKGTQVLIRVKASSINVTECFPFIEPLSGMEVSAGTKKMFAETMNAIGKVIGLDISGVVEKVGESVTKLKAGDEVYAYTADLFGGWAEYAVTDEEAAYLKPGNLSFEESAALPSTVLTALGAVRFSDIKEGAKFLNRVHVYGDVMFIFPSASVG